MSGELSIDTPTICVGQIPKNHHESSPFLLITLWQTNIADIAMENHGKSLFSSMFHTFHRFLNVKTGGSITVKSLGGSPWDHGRVRCRSSSCPPPWTCPSGGPWGPLDADMSHEEYHCWLGNVWVIYDYSMANLWLIYGIIYG